MREQLIAILEELYHKGCITVATTHYGEIKNFSEQHLDFENAAMEFKEVNYKRLKLEIKALELYLEGYDLNQLFV